MQHIGIPYAENYVKNGRLFRECPVCKVMIEEVTDDTGEDMTNNYGVHFIQQHEDHPEHPDYVPPDLVA